MSVPRWTMEKLYVASDHAGLALKEHLLKVLPELPWEDLGPYSQDSVDYPDYADKLVEKIQDEKSIGILICGSGQGMAIRANRHPHIRAALCWNEDVTKMSRLHNNANVLCLGARTVEFSQAERIVLTFLDSDFEGGRHQRRVDKLNQPPTK